MMRRNIWAAGMAAVLLSVVMATPVFGAVYKKTDERYPQGDFMILLDSPGNGSYALGVQEKQWVLRPVANLNAVVNEDSAFLFSFEPTEKDQKWVNDPDLWDANHSMAIRCAEGYLSFDSTGVEFQYSKPIVADTPQYHWQYIKKDGSDAGSYLLFKGSYETAGKAGAIWAKANAEKQVLTMASCGKGSDVYLYQEAVGETVPKSAGSWQEYQNGYNKYGWKYVNPDGSIKQNEWYSENGQSYYFDNDGVTLVGFHQLPDGNYYYFTQNAALLTNSEISVDRVSYRMGEDGICYAVPEDDPTRTAVTTEQFWKDDEVLNWINLKRKELGLPPVYRDNRLSAMAEEVANRTTEILDWQTLNELGTQRGISFMKRGNLRMNWNEDIRNLSLETYYNTDNLKQVVTDPELNHIGIFSKELPYVETRDVILVFGAY